MTETTERQRAQVDAHLILRRGDEILLGLRQNTGWGDGCWHFPAGHGEGRESAATTLVREAHEELGITIDPADVRFAHAMHHWTGSARMGMFFEVTEWAGDPVNTEPDKCAEWRWWPLAALPEQLIPYAALALAAYAKNEPYSERGWE
jgi:8-oxo-dGTP pyrophosphatase MutT (NUDIX family)